MNTCRGLLLDRETTSPLQSARRSPSLWQSTLRPWLPQRLESRGWCSLAHWVVAWSFSGELLSLQRTSCGLSHSDSEMLICLHWKDGSHLRSLSWLCTFIYPNILRPVEAGPLFVTLIDVFFIQRLSFLSSSNLDREASTPQRRVLIVQMQWSEMKVLVAQSCLTLCDPMDCSPPGPSVHGILQARILEWAAITLSRGSSQPRDRTQVSCTAVRLFTSLSHQRSPVEMQRIPFYEFQNSGHLSIWKLQYKKAWSFNYNIAEWESSILLLSSDFLDLWWGTEGSSKKW